MQSTNKIRFRKKAVFIALALLSAIALTAQPASPLRDSTAGLFSGDLDNVVSVTGYGSVDFKRVFVGAAYGYVSEGFLNGLPATTFRGNVLNAGALFNAGPVRLGMAYTGALGNGGLYSKSKSTDGGSDTTTEEKRSYNDHTAYILAGFPAGRLNLGIRAGLNISGDHLNTEVNSTETDDRNTLSYRPQLMVGTSVALPGGWAITPTINFGVTIAEAWRTFEQQSGDFYASHRSGDVRSLRAFTPSGEAEVGVTFPVQTFSLTGTVNYGLGYSFMPGKYERKVNDDNSVDEHVYRTDERLVNTITVQVTGRKDLTEKLALVGRVRVQVGIDNWVSGGTKSITPGSSASPVQTTEQTDVTLTPRLLLAGTYQLGEKLGLSAGVAFDPATYVYSTSKRHDEEVATTSSKMSSTSHTVYVPSLSTLGFGMTFTPVQSFSVQLAVTLQNPQSWNDVLGGSIRLAATWKN